MAKNNTEITKPLEFKQEKVVKNIQKDVGDSASLRLAKTNPNDECYTSMQAIIDELQHYSRHLKNKKIICPCDWDIVEGEEVYSINISFKEDVAQGETNTIPEQITIFNANVPYNIESQIVDENEIKEFFEKRLKCNFIRTLVQNAKKWKINCFYI